MRLYLDTADLTACRRWLPSGLFYGVTTNPLILQRDGVPCTLEALGRLVRELLEMGAQEVQAQPWGTAEGKREGARALCELGERVVPKLGLTPEGAALCHELRSQDPARKVTLTGVYAPHQALVALAAGASYLAPYFGRMNEAGRDALSDVTRMHAIVRQGAPGGQRTEVLVASLRNVTELSLLAERGLSHFTFSPAIAGALFREGLTERALADFERAAEPGP